MRKKEWRQNALFLYTQKRMSVTDIARSVGVCRETVSRFINGGGTGGGANPAIGGGALLPTGEHSSPLQGGVTEDSRPRIGAAYPRRGAADTLKAEHETAVRILTYEKY